MKRNENHRVKVVHCPSGKVILEEAKLAEAFWPRLKGLLGRKSLPPGQGLIIRPCSSIHTLGMAFPIDAGFVDGEGRLCCIYENLPPWRLNAGSKEAKYVIEAPAGTFAAVKLRTGDLVTLEEIQVDRAREDGP